MDEQQTGGAATWRLPNLTRAARLGTLSSHRHLREVAAGACMADWAPAGSWASEAITTGQWIDADPAEAARLDAADAVSESWEVAPLSYGGDAYAYEGRGAFEVPFEEDGRRCRVVSNGFALATICDEEEGE